MDTKIERYGEDAHFVLSMWQYASMVTNHGPDIFKKLRRKQEKRMRRKYGKEWGKRFMGNRKVTNMRKYGVEEVLQSPKIRKKIVRTLRKRYGVDHIRQSEIIRNKIYKTMLERYGVKHAMQNPDSHEKQQRSAFRAKSFKIKGKKFRVRGFGPQAIKVLVCLLYTSPSPRDS